ncbi:DUF4394 domain-containing protein [Methyloversatilis sp. XJ19-49]|uniref:DUF4394 domain-containing protein n=1 Tax=Methyloversatilis sp. XJ19-49 TaxID=2963429 RepID=UPI00211CB618|nr:DUF4394 domain-containing protein [Methyloversatilis sp. XJ19-49]MCQ9379539.1 DUF4394 domain-containing protein [Methyloversatilis sp. XJ19-49]
MQITTRLPLLTLASTACLLAACAGTPDIEGPPRKETVFAVTQSHRLISFNAGQPGRLLSDVALTGLDNGEQLLGIDYRVARGVMFALGSTGRIFTVDVARGQLKPVGNAKFAAPLKGQRFGFDFNPAADRIRIVSDTRQNLRAHPDTGALVDASPDTAGLQPDGTLTYAEGDTNAAVAPNIVAAGYTYNQEDEKLTTNFAIDAATGALVRQGSVEGVKPVVSPNTGKLFTVGALGIAGLADAHFDIADVSNDAYAAASTAQDATPQFYLIDLKTGAATRLGRVGKGEPLRGIAIEP